MRFCTIWPLLVATAAATGTQTHPRPIHIRDYDSHDYYAVHLRPGIDPQHACAALGMHYEGPLALDDHHMFRAAEKQHGYDHIKSLRHGLRRRRRKREAGADEEHALDHVLLAQKQELHRRFPLVKRASETRPSKRQRTPAANQHVQSDVQWAVQEGLAVAENLSIADPIFQEQWHLHNHRDVGHDINVTGVWQQGITGKGSTVCIVDDGLDLDSDDLKDNYFAEGSWDYNDPGPDPKPRLSDDHHGTRCAGEVAAVRNDVCGVGVAYDGKVSGIRILSKVISDVDEAEAMIYAYDKNQIYSCSWGPPDDGQAMEAPGILIKRAMVQGIQKGRGGLGSIYVFAIGNGAASDDNCNFDGYTNSIYSVSVGGIDRKGNHPYYSEKCSAQLVVTYSSGSGDAIHTTDVGQNACYTNHGGTSAAGPLVAGIYALMMEVNPHLTWRDIQWLTVLNAVKLEDQGDDYQLNKAVGRDFSHQFGYGKADAYALVEAAKTWKSVKPQAWYYSPWLHVQHGIPQGDQGLASSYEVTADVLKEANLERIEHVTVTMNVEHTRRGDLSVELHSPSGMVSHIATHRRNDNKRAGYVDWTFMSVAHWGESGVGNWTVIVKDTKVNENTGTFTDWHLKLFGECINAEKQTLLPMPTKHDDDDHELTELPTHTASVHTTSVAVPTETGEPEGNPTDHPERPTKPKPTPEPTPSPEVDGSKPQEDEHEDSTPAASTTENDKPNFLPHPFPTFGVSKKTQQWIYGSIGLILAFLVALGAWALYQRRKRHRLHGNNYDFEMVNREDDGDDDESAPLAAAAAHRHQNGNHNRATVGKKKRAGELYDAFAEGSDDDADDFSLGSDDEDVEDVEGVVSHGSGSGSGDEKRERYRDVEGS